MANRPYINGVVYDYAHIEATIHGELCTGFKSINYDDSCTPGKARGTQAWVQMRTTGQYEAKGDIEFYRTEYDGLIKRLGAGFYTVEFPIVVTYGAGAEPMITDTLKLCRFTSVGASNSEGTDPLTVKVGLDIVAIMWNGVPPLPGMENL